MSKTSSKNSDDRRKLRIEQKHARARQEILQAAEQLLVEKGLEAVTLASVAGRLNLSKQALYHYYSSKEALVISLTAALLDNEIDAILAALQQADPDEGCLGVMIRTFYGHYIAHLDAFRTIYCQSQLTSSVALRPDEQTIRERVNPRTRELFSYLEERLATEGMSKKQRAAVRRLAYSAWLAALGLVTMLGVAESAGDPLVHKDSDLVETLAGVFNAAAESLGAQKTG
ncbi:MAG: TetR/AcrR family transcriptional regulator [Gammaproteobacteria bacterium]|nr:TetR/AcrR family transcriptional regulator [Pseudomonadales bacterium]